MKSNHIDDEDESFKKPTDEEIHETAEATRVSLEKITAVKVFFSSMELDFLFFFRSPHHYQSSMQRKQRLHNIFVTLLASRLVVFIQVEHNKELFVWLKSRRIQWSRHVFS